MIDNYHKRVLILAVRAGEMMMKAGAEIYRVEDTITRICKACGITYVDVFATPTGIFVTLDEGSRDSDVFTYIKRIKGSETNLTTISELNRFSREFAATDLSVESGMDILDDLSGKKKYPRMLRLLASALVAAAFCMLFGGTPLDFMLAFIIGMVSYAFARFLDIFEVNFFIRGFLCTFMATLMALFAHGIEFATNTNSIIIGVLMIFVPGVAITNSLRDFISGDMVSGLARLAETVIIAVSLAAGAGLMLEIWSFMGGAII